MPGFAAVLRAAHHDPARVPALVVHIELTDHLRCPEPHDEAFLVLIPDAMDGRRVTAGHLGCPVCGWSTDWDDGIPVFGEVASPVGAPPFDAGAALAMLGVEGPGGWLALAGTAGALAHDLAVALPDVSMVAVNPPEDVASRDAVSVIRSRIWPVKRHAMRGVVIGAGVADIAAAMASALPGLQVVGQGIRPALGPGDELVAEADGVWVIRHR
jgi:hypothetical protein